MIKKFIYIFTAISGILAGVSSCSLIFLLLTSIRILMLLLMFPRPVRPDICLFTISHYEYELSILGDDFCQTSITGKDMSQKNLYLWRITL
mgnify:CR=1 FL=1